MSDSSQGEGWWLASDEKWYPPAPATLVPSAASPVFKGRSVFTMAMVTALVGWAIVGLAVLLWLFVDEQTNCTAHSGDAYQRCLRGSDLNGLRAQGVVMGLAMMSAALLVIGVARMRRLKTDETDRMRLPAIALSVSLVVISIGGWVLGVNGLWAPERPFPYDPVSTSEGSTILVTGGLIGLVAGILIGAAMAFSKASGGSGG